MKKLLCLLISIWLSSFAMAQSLSPQLLSSAGTKSSGTNHSLSWSLGEVAITKIASANNMLTQGFHQPKGMVNFIKSNLPDNFSIRLFPNPTSEKLIVQIQNNDWVNTTVRIVDILGREIIIKQFSSPQFEIDLGNYASGMYLVQLVNEHHQLLGTHLIQKID